MSIEAMKLALEELEGCYVTFYEDEDIAEAITALRQAIEQAQKQEPDKYVMDIECTNCGTKQSGILTVNTTPPQRQWVGLTDEDISEIVRGTHNTLSFVRAIETKIKQKNGYAEEKKHDTSTKSI